MWACSLKRGGIADKVKHKSLVIPGYAAAIMGDLEEELPRLEYYHRTARSRPYSEVP
jgi:hypothetical protein